MSPLILTATFDPESSRLLQALRDRYFPARLNIVPAHLTLFHHLPGDERSGIAAWLEEVCADVAPIDYRVGGLRFLGRGVALEIEASPLVAMRAGLAGRWQAWLTRQDAQGFRPHVTIQNKVAAREARATWEALGQTLGPLGGTITGLDLYSYRDGPWEHAASFAFLDTEPA